MLQSIILEFSKTASLVAKNVTKKTFEEPQHPIKVRQRQLKIWTWSVVKGGIEVVTNLLAIETDITRDN